MLKQYLNQISPLSNEEWTAFQSILKKEILSKKHFFLLQGEVCNRSAFVEKGLFKISLTDSKGNERIVQINPENTFISDCESYQQQKPSELTIEPLEDSEIWVFKNIDLQALCKNFPIFDKIGRQVTHQILSYYKEHINLLMTKTPQERYEYLLKHYPTLIQRVSVTHLSQFLGLTRETLSRLRGKIMY